MEFPKRVRTADWKNGFLVLDGEKSLKFSVDYGSPGAVVWLSLVGFHVRDYPLNDILLKPFFRA